MKSLQCIFAGKRSKLGEPPEACQDAFSISDKRCAVADGATISFFAGIWAELLVERFKANAEIESLHEWKAPIQAKWSETVDSAINQASSALKRINTNKRNSGACASATFLGIEVEGNLCKIFSVGDCGLFIFCKDEILLEIAPQTFNNHPYFITTKNDGKEPAVNYLKYHFPKNNTDEIFIALATDELAKWMCEEIKGGRTKDCLNEILDIEGNAGFDDFIVKKRNFGLFDDDITLIVTKVSNEPKQEIDKPSKKGSKSLKEDDRLPKKDGKSPKKRGLQRMLLYMCFAFLFVASIILVIFLDVLFFAFLGYVYSKYH